MNSSDATTCPASIFNLGNNAGTQTAAMTSDSVTSQYIGMMRTMRLAMKSAGVWARDAVVVHITKPLMTKKISTPALPM